MYLEWGGGDFSTLGYIFHGQDEFYNLEHEPVSEKVSLRRNGVTPSKTKEFLKSPCFFRS